MGIRYTMNDLVTINQIVSMGITIIICFLLPLLLLIIIKRKTKYLIGALVVGALSFYISQMVIRIPLLQLVQSKITIGNSWRDILVLALCLGLSAALFEEMGRYFSIKLLLKEEKYTYKTGIVHGIGHGGCEAILLVGINYIVMTAVAFSIFRNGLDSSLFLKFPEFQQQTLLLAFENNTPSMFLLAGIERAITIFFHIAISVMIMEGIVREKTKRFFWLAIVLHTALDAGVVILSKVGCGYWLIESFILIFAIGGILYAILAKKRFGDKINPQNSAARSVEEGY